MRQSPYLCNRADFEKVDCVNHACVIPALKSPSSDNVIKQTKLFQFCFMVEVRVGLFVFVCNRVVAHL